MFTATWARTAFVALLATTEPATTEATTQPVTTEPIAEAAPAATEPKEPAAEALETVVIATDSKTPQLEKNATQRVLVISERELVRTEAPNRNITDLLANQPGFFVSTLSRNDANWGSYGGLGPKYNVRSSCRERDKVRSSACAPLGSLSSLAWPAESFQSATSRRSSSPGAQKRLTEPSEVKLSTDEPGSSARTVAYRPGQRRSTWGPSMRSEMTRFGPTARTMG